MYFYHIAYQLKRAEHALALACEEQLRPLQVTLSQTMVLLFADRFPRSTFAQLASLANIAPPTLYRIAVNLEKRNLLHRERKDGNDKSFYLSLSPAGVTLLRRAETQLKIVQDRAKPHLSTSELTTLYTLLGKYEVVFQKSKKETIWTTRPQINRQ
jgi:DNA-binding MarR family transcriptional regulator